MTIIGDVLKELFKMFVADIRLTTATLLAVVLVAVSLRFSLLAPIYAGPLLAVLTIGILLRAVLGEATRKSAGR